MPNLGLGLALNQRRRISVALSLGVSSDGLTMTFTNLGGDAFSITISGSATAAKNQTYTTDTQGRTLTGALLESERALCLLAPAVGLTNDIDGDTLIDPLDTVGLTYDGLWIYDEDQGIPDAPTVQWIRGASTVISGATEPTYVTGSADINATVKLRESYAGQTVDSNTLTVENASAMSVDPDALFHYDPDNITVDGSNNVTAWPDSSGNGHNFNLQPTGIALPVWDAATSAVQVRSANPNAIRTTGNGPIRSTLSTGGSVAVFMVITPQTADQALQFIFGENAIDGARNSQNFGIDVNGGTSNLDLNFSARESTTDILGDATALNPTTSALTAGPKILIRFEITPTEGRAYINGTLEWSGPVSGAPTNARQISLGARVRDDGTFDSPANTDIHEIFGTSNLSADNITAIESELNTIHGL